jgi:hypothetical protein
MLISSVQNSVSWTQKFDHLIVEGLTEERLDIWRNKQNDENIFEIKQEKTFGYDYIIRIKAAGSAWVLEVNMNCGEIGGSRAFVYHC